MSYRIYHLLFPAVLAFTLSAPAQTLKRPPGQESTSKPQSQSQSKEEEPPEEDESAKPKEYAFNPLQAAHEIQVGDFYMKKGSLAAAVKRYTEAIRWNPTLAEAYLKLGDAEAKFKDQKAAKEAYAKYLELAPDSKQAPTIKKKLSKM